MVGLVVGILMVVLVGRMGIWSCVVWFGVDWCGLVGWSVGWSVGGLVWFGEGSGGVAGHKVETTRFAIVFALQLLCVATIFVLQ